MIRENVGPPIFFFFFNHFQTSPYRPLCLQERPRLPLPRQHVGPDDARVPVEGGLPHHGAHGGRQPVGPGQSRQPGRRVRRLRGHDRPPADVGSGGRHQGQAAAAAPHGQHGAGGQLQRPGV